MMRRAVGGVCAAAVSAFVLVGCAPGASSALTVTYEVDGTEQAFTLNPDNVTCDETTAHGFSLGDHPGRFNIRLRVGEQSNGKVGGSNEDGLVVFEGSELDLSVSGRVLTVGESVGEVAFLEGWAPGDDDADAEDAVRVPGTLSGSITCEVPVVLLTPDP